ncbi:glycosyltransferase family 2 protein [Larkinella sp. C7]|uniref:glycosyltransferase family 2 protein n=1 Tax=Larkinella sp. C7 TaxID=2576607 RepID=UPI0011112E44|nr:glycosyltransferase family 2 protein [Larkinella sp. C7]
MSELLIVIVNWNSGEQLQRCVESVLNSTYNSYKIHIYDNCSTDNSIKNIPLYDNVEIYKGAFNIGFSKACNHIIKLNKSKFVLLLNPDTVLEKHTLSDAINFINVNNNVHILGVRHYNEYGMTKTSCSRFPTFRGFVYDIIGFSKLWPYKFNPATVMTDLDYNKSQYVDQVMGAFFLFPFELLTEIGLFDEQYFVYFEELDFSYRAFKKGYMSYYCTDIAIFHKGGGTSEQALGKSLYYLLNSRLKYIKKHFTPVEYYFLFIMTFLIEPFTRLFFLVSNRQFKRLKDLFETYKFLYFDKILK